MPERSTRLILASASPRRKDLLKQIGLLPAIHPSQVIEPPYTGDDPAGYAMELANLKADEIAKRYPDDLVIGADTIVVINNQVLGKPENKTAARRMLNLLSNRTHQVITAYSMHLKNYGIRQGNHVLTQVTFKALSDDEINTYIRSGAPMDKAGSYGIQDYSGIFVDRIEGCFYNVVGLPLSDFNSKLQELLAKHHLTLKE